MDTNPNTLKNFNEKVEYFLGYLYENGGAEYQGNDFDTSRAYQLAGAWTQDEFNRIIEALKSKGLISWGGVTKAIGGGALYFDVKLTEAGIVKAERTRPQMPMLGLVSQQITTGDKQADEKINYAKHTFFAQPTNLESMRSACETLSHVLEPLREELKLAITVADVNVFFKLVNDFDIRHNKPHTINLVHPEQLEWIFYSLLNTINTYTKLKSRLGN